MKTFPDYRQELQLAKKIWFPLTKPLIQKLLWNLRTYRLSVSRGDLVLLSGSWFITNAGLLSIASRKRCFGIRVAPVRELCDRLSSRYAFRATVYTSANCRGFVGYGDADPANVSPLVHGAEMRVAETRAVNRALRKAYGIGICSVEELGTSPFKLATGNSNGNQSNGYSMRLRDHLCQLIRRHGLDAELVKTYAVDFCGTKTLREAKREQVEKFVAHLADWGTRDRDALLSKLNSYAQPKAGAA